MYGMAGLAKKLKIPNCIKTTGNCVYFCREIQYPDLRKFDRKLCILYVRWFGFAEKLNIQNSVIQRIIVYIICTKCLDLQKY